MIHVPVTLQSTYRRQHFINLRDCRTMFFKECAHQIIHKSSFGVTMGKCHWFSLIVGAFNGTCGSHTRMQSVTPGPKQVVCPFPCPWLSFPTMCHEQSDSEGLSRSPLALNLWKALVWDWVSLDLSESHARRTGKLLLRQTWVRIPALPCISHGTWKCLPLHDLQTLHLQCKRASSLCLACMTGGTPGK